VDTSADRAARFAAVHRGGRHTVRTVVLIVAGAVLALACTGGVVLQIVGGRRERAVLRTAGDATDRFVRDLEAGDHTAAYGLLCATTRDELSPEQFESGLRGRPQVRAHRIAHATLRNGGGHAGATIVEDLTLDGGTTDTHTFAMLQEGGSWRVCNRSWPY
jgi:hypothetical protein